MTINLKNKTTKEIQKLVDFLKNPQIIKTIIEELEKMAGRKFNDSAILAGQAVSSKIFELLNLDINPVINDIDLFFFHSIYSYENSGENFQKINSTASFQVGLNELYDNYGHISFLVKKEFFKVLGTKRFGLINYVFVNFNNWEIGYPNDTIYFNQKIARKIKFQLLIESFDINAVQVGIDLKTKEIYFTEDFLNFLMTKQMQLSTYMTPIHSIIRLERKAKEIGVYAKIENEILASWLSQQIFNVAYKYYNPFLKDKNNEEKISFFMNLLNGTPLFFGQKHFKQFEKNVFLKEIVLCKNINEILHTNTNVSLFSLNLKEKGQKLVESQIEFLNSFYKNKNLHGNFINMLNIANDFLIDEKLLVKKIKHFYGMQKNDTFAKTLKQKCVTGIPETEKVELIVNFFQYLLVNSSKVNRAYKKAKYSKKSKTYFFIEKAQKKNNENVDKMYNIPFLSGAVNGKIRLEECFSFLYENIKYSEHNPQLIFQIAKKIHKTFKNQPHYVYSGFLYCFINETLNNSIKMFNKFFSYSEPVRLTIIGKAEKTMEENNQFSGAIFSVFKCYITEDVNQEKIEEELTKDIFKPLKKDKFVFENKDLKIIELITKFDLMKEGMEMNHCVGGYDEHVQNNRSIILKVLNKKNNVRATIELAKLEEITNFGNKTKKIIFKNEKNGREYKKEYVIVQFKGKNNKTNWSYSEINEILEIINSRFSFLPLTHYDTKDIVNCNFSNYVSVSYPTAKPRQS